MQKTSGKLGQEVECVPSDSRSLTDKPPWSQGFHGLFQRLIQKEKQVVQLQVDLDRLKAQNLGEDREAVRWQFAS